MICLVTIILAVLDLQVVSAAIVPPTSRAPPKKQRGKGGSFGGIVAGAGMALGPWLGGVIGAMDVLFRGAAGAMALGAVPATRLPEPLREEPTSIPEPARQRQRVEA
ncbi:hypothetical protein ABZS96_00205 [Streptomyces avermitilis]|uniref:hypothetical protein n=1 Tax=Streptomyces avermitilis TaxID=33903 RepID=UPI0033B8D41C